MATKSYEKMIEEIGNMSVLELADFVKALEDKFGVSAAAMSVAAAPVAGAAAAAPVAEEKSSYKVTLKDGGPEKIKTIKAVRQVITTLSLSDAKKAVEETPTVLLESAPKADAEKIKKELEAVGAKVELA
jgi:large subunit ribosomal protein L7/L12